MMRASTLSALLCLTSILCRSTCHFLNNVADAAAHQEIDVKLDGSVDSCYSESDDGIHCDDASPMLLYDDDEGEGMGLTQYLRADEDRLNDVQDILQNARRFLANFNFSNPKFRQLREECKNKHELCALWAAKGECKTNPLYMNLTCAPVCQACEYLLPEVRCPVDPNAVDAWHQPEDLNRMFERMTTHLDFQGYEPRILSSPTRTSDKAGAVLPQGDFPWVVIFDNFLSPQESGHLIGLIQEESYELSRVVLPEEQLNGIIPGRPNSYSVCHCLSTVCVQDETVQSILRRLEDVTRIPRDNYEHMHMLRYHVGQYTDTHTDFIFQHAREQQGARIFTVLMYLNHVEAGGGTYFPHLNVTVAPKPGRALIWPSVLNDEPNSMDNRTDHRGLPVVQGVKYAASFAVHQRNFQAPYSMHCVSRLLTD